MLIPSGFFLLGALLNVPGVFALPGHQPSKATVRLEVDLTWEDLAPNGGVRKVILTNGQFPGPPLELNQGDDVEFVARNYLPFPISIHFHGIDQLHTPWSDGVPGLSQRPIQPGSSFLYRWTATQYGTYWYHAHARGHISDGLYGPIIIKPSSNEPTAFGRISNSSSAIKAMRHAENHPIPLIVSDWTQFTSEEIINFETAAGIDDFCVDSILVNGKGSEICLSRAEIDEFTVPVLGPILNGTKLTDKGCIPSNNLLGQGPFFHDLTKLPPRAFDVCTPTTGPTEVITVNPADGWFSLNIISSTFISNLAVSVDEHPMWIYEVDGRHIEPVLVDAVSVTSGGRYNALIKLDKTVGDYTIRVANQGINQVVVGTATLSYFGSNHTRQSVPFINENGANVTADVVTLDDTKIVPFPPEAPAATADATHLLHIEHVGQAYKWTLSGKESYGLDLENEVPLLFDPTSAEARNPNLTITTKMGQWVDLVISVTFPVQPPHPLHKHSNSFFVIGGGPGSFNWSTVAEAIEEVPQFFNLKNPPIRDGTNTIPTSTEETWIAIRYQVVNPGAFIFHCHTQTHFEGGMAVAILDGIDAFPKVPQEYLSNNGFDEWYRVG